MITGMIERPRCGWCGTDPLYVRYHDEEWGVAQHDDHQLFEMLTLEGAQAGLSWITVLRKREAYREAFAGFDPERVARFTPASVEKLLTSSNIVKNRLKIESTISNAKAFISIQSEFGSFDHYLWTFVEGKPVIGLWKRQADVPSETELSQRISKDLKKRGFRFVGSTICYAFLQATGVVNDHVAACWRSIS